MKRTSKIIGGIALVAFGIFWALELLDVISISLEGWWALFVIVPCFVNIFSDRHKAGAIIGFGIGILLLLAARGIIPWNDIWKYMLCLAAVVWGVSLLFFNNKKSCCHCHNGESSTPVVLDGIKQHKIDVTFGKQEYSYDGQTFEGADVHVSFGFAGLDLRDADIRDGAAAWRYVSPRASASTTASTPPSPASTATAAPSPPTAPRHSTSRDTATSAASRSSNRHPDT